MTTPREGHRGRGRFARAQPRRGRAAPRGRCRRVRAAPSRPDSDRGRSTARRASTCRNPPERKPAPPGCAARPPGTGRGGVAAPHRHEQAEPCTAEALQQALTLERRRRTSDRGDLRPSGTASRRGSRDKRDADGKHRQPERAGNSSAARSDISMRVVDHGHAQPPLTARALLGDVCALNRIPGENISQFGRWRSAAPGVAFMIRRHMARH